MRPNRRPGRCLDCGEPVEPGTGMIRRVGAKEWGAVHPEGQHSAPPTTTVVVPQRRSAPRVNRFAGNCEGCGEHVPVGRGSDAEGIVKCSDCTYGAS